MPVRIPWSSLLKYGLPALVVGFLLFKIATGLINYGAGKVQAEWDKDIAAHNKEVARLEKEIADNERTHRQEARQISDRLADAQATYAADIAALRNAAAQRMRESADRAEVYEYLSDSGAVERANLASYAAQLDRSLVQGRQLVGELRATVVQRDEQILGLAEQIHSDRRLIAGNTTGGE
jgi:hypothetical protein